MITFCLVLVEMQPMESHDVMSNLQAVTELCASQSARPEEIPEEPHLEGEHTKETHGRRLHGDEQHLGLTCEVQWCIFNESAIVNGQVISPLCIPDCEVTGACQTKPECSISEFFDEVTQEYTKITDEDVCIAQGGSWGRSFLENYMLRYNWPKAQTHLAASFILMTMWFVSNLMHTTLSQMIVVLSCA